MPAPAGFCWLNSLLPRPRLRPFIPQWRASRASQEEPARARVSLRHLATVFLQGKPALRAQLFHLPPPPVLLRRANYPPRLFSHEALFWLLPGLHPHPYLHLVRRRTFQEDAERAVFHSFTPRSSSLSHSINPFFHSPPLTLPRILFHTHNCAYMRACMRACARAGVCVCVIICIYFSSMRPEWIMAAAGLSRPVYPIFSLHPVILHKAMRYHAVRVGLPFLLLLTYPILEKQKQSKRPSKTDTKGETNSA